jgi:hypothetical protein
MLTSIAPANICVILLHTLAHSHAQTLHKRSRKALRCYACKILENVGSSPSLRFALGGRCDVNAASLSTSRFLVSANERYDTAPTKKHSAMKPKFIWARQTCEKVGCGVG